MLLFIYTHIEVYPCSIFSTLPHFIPARPEPTHGGVVEVPGQQFPSGVVAPATTAAGRGDTSLPGDGAAPPHAPTTPFLGPGPR